MKPQEATLDGMVRLFAHRGAAAQAPQNTGAAFELALLMGANGVASEAWATADGGVVLSSDGHVGSRLRRRRIGSVPRSELPEHLCTIEEFYDAVGAETAALIHLQDPAAFEPLLTAARAVDPSAEQQLWLGHPEVATLTEWRRSTEAKLVLTTSLRSQKGSPEQLVSKLREHGIEGLELPHGEWHGGLVATAHRFERYAMARGLDYEREMAKMLRIGIDALSSGHVDRMTAIAAQFG